jgi:hypothetical protein
MATVQQITLQAASNSVAFADINASLPQVMGQVHYDDYVGDWQNLPPYQQKILNTDNIAIQIKTQLGAGGSGNYPKLYICDHFKNVIPAVNLNADPYLKGVQHVAGDNFVNPYTGTSTPMQTALWVFSFNNFATQIPAGGVFYLRLDNIDTVGPVTTSYYSEPLYVSNTLPDTLLFTFFYDADNAEKNIVNGGWYNDFSSGSTSPYNLQFSLRVEGIITNEAPKGINIGYLQQSYNQLQIKTNQKRIRTLKLGEISIGIPDYLLEMATEAVQADNLFINGYGYILYGANSDHLADIWKMKRPNDAWPLVMAECGLMERYTEQRALMNPIFMPPTKIFTDVFDDTFD